MRNFLFVVIVSSLIFSCKEAPKKEKLIMYEQSEMAALMNLMYLENEKIKTQILNGDAIDSFPEEYLKIHSAVLTDPSDRTPSFNSFSNAYILNMKDLFAVPKDSLSIQFNQTINSCIACHQTVCPGPIPRIKKLLIN